jgi:hypothetical protein
VYNLTTRDNFGYVVNYQRRTSNGTVNNIPTMYAYYRIHQNRTMAGTTLPANTGCARPDSTEQIGCLAEASPCSIGLAGLPALRDPATGQPDPDRKGLGLRSPVNSAPGIATFPVETALRRLRAPSCPGTLSAADKGFEDRYPLAWISTGHDLPNEALAGAPVLSVNGSG